MEEALHDRSDADARLPAARRYYEARLVSRAQKPEAPAVAALIGRSLVLQVPRGPEIAFAQDAPAPGLATPPNPATSAERLAVRFAGTSLAVEVPRGPATPFLAHAARARDRRADTGPGGCEAAIEPSRGDVARRGGAARAGDAVRRARGADARDRRADTGPGGREPAIESARRDVARRGGPARAGDAVLHCGEAEQARVPVAGLDRRAEPGKAAPPPTG